MPFSALSLQADSIRIPDPFIGFNELEVQWVAERRWTYRTTIRRPDVREGTRVALVFEGLDTFAEVRLNGRSILKSENMFLSHRCDVTELVKPNVDNELHIEFDSALLRGREIEKEHPEYRFLSVASIPGENGRVGVRKAQYHWVGGPKVKSLIVLQAANMSFRAGTGVLCS